MFRILHLFARLADLLIKWVSNRGGGGGEGGNQLFFSGRGVRSGFPKWGACELIIASEEAERGVL